MDANLTIIDRTLSQMIMYLKCHFNTKQEMNVSLFHVYTVFLIGEIVFYDTLLRVTLNESHTYKLHLIFKQNS